MKKTSILSIALLLQLSVTAQKISRIEPSNWWVGMKYSTITLLVYGDNIANLNPTINYPDIQLSKLSELRIETTCSSR
ncbi:MAG: cyclomaltodextrinase N-terminal domain-containing protein [Saprospiraceae bacterium]|nr:cyclomaltodextrinase N-terminal domain-containing protein [Saprospiraceae bacterium]